MDSNFADKLTTLCKAETISKQQVYELMNQAPDYQKIVDEDGERFVNIDYMIKAIRKILVDDSIRQGTWILGENDYNRTKTCSVCGTEQYRERGEIPPDFCPICGSRMIG